MWRVRKWATQQAGGLRFSAQAFAVSSLQQIMEEYPVLKDILRGDQDGLEDWDLFMTVAGIGAGMMLVDARLSARQRDSLSLACEHELNEVCPAGSEMVADLLHFVAKRRASGLQIPEAVGLWVIWNLHKDEPTNMDAFKESELQLAIIIGNMIIASMKGAARV